jgi:hypothetical protein
VWWYPAPRQDPSSHVALLWSCSDFDTVAVRNGTLVLLNLPQSHPHPHPRVLLNQHSLRLTIHLQPGCECWKA